MSDSLGALRAGTSVSAATPPADGARTSVRPALERNEFRAPPEASRRLERGLQSTSVRLVDGEGALCRSGINSALPRGLAPIGARTSVRLVDGEGALCR